MSGVLVIVESIAGKPSAASLELLALARWLAGQAPVSVLLPREPAGEAVALGAFGADVVYSRTGAGSSGIHVHDDADTRLALAECAARACGASLVLAPHTALGLDLAPRLAFRLGSAVATGCEAIERAADGRLVFTRLCNGGNARERVSIRSSPAVATVRAGSCAALTPDPARMAQPVTLDIDAGAARPRSRMRVVQRARAAAGDVRLEDARVIVAGGRGVGGPEGFALLAGLADVLGGAIGASRVPCDLGWCAHAMQIGLSGRTVSPDLYFAIGISGASHHLAGCGSARTLVAINSDPDAAIFRHARFGVVGDLHAVVPALTEALARSAGARASELRSAHP